MANEVAEKKETFSVALMNNLDEVSDALPIGFNKTRFVQNAVALLNENDTLQDFAKSYGTSQIKAGMLKGAYLGLDFMNKEAYLIPYKNQLNFMIDYRGSVKLCKKYAIRPIKDIYAKIVKKGDDFEESIINGMPTINYKPLPFNDNETIGAFAVCLFEDGGMQYDVMSLKELENTRKSSKASNSPAWTKFTDEMYKKTVLHRLCKHIEIDFASAEQRVLFDDDVAMETNPLEQRDMEVSENANTEEFIDAEAVEVSEVKK